MQSYYAESGWMAANARIAGALLLGSSIWILVLSFLSLAISASVKWKPAAGALLFGAFFVMAGFGAAMNEILRSRWGGLINIRTLMATVWVALFEPPERRGLGAVFFRIPESAKIPLWCAWAALLTICLLCVYMLVRKIRGAEVVR